MSFMYYPYLFNSDIFKMTEDNLDSADAEINEAINYDYDFEKFGLDLSELAYEYIIDGDIRGNLPQILALTLDEELVDIEDEETQEILETNSSLLKKLGSNDGLFMSQGILAPFVGYISKEEVIKLIDFLNTFSFQLQPVEILKIDFLKILDVAKTNNMGLIYMYS